MGFTPLDYNTWERREFLEFFGATTLYMTVELDITRLYHALKQRKLRLFPALVYCVARVVNSHVAFRYGHDAQGAVGVWDVIHPFYTVPRRGNPELFSMNHTLFCEDFTAFYEAFLRDYAAAEVCGRLLCGQTLPPNVCGVSVAPGTRFSAFAFGGDPKPDFTPFVLFGKLTQESGRALLPVSGEFAHAVNDGIHISRFFDELAQTANGLFGDV